MSQLIGGFIGGILILLRSSDPNEKGNGLGLSITKRIIDLMHGTIEVSSQVDEGSCFTVILPLEKA